MNEEIWSHIKKKKEGKEKEWYFSSKCSKCRVCDSMSNIEEGGSAKKMKITGVSFQQKKEREKLREKADSVRRR